jgi:hypothetical protein
MNPWAFFRGKLATSGKLTNEVKDPLRSNTFRFIGLHKYTRRLVG